MNPRSGNETPNEIPLEDFCKYTCHTHEAPKLLEFQRLTKGANPNKNMSTLPNSRMLEEDIAESQHNPWHNLGGAAPVEQVEVFGPKSRQDNREGVFSDIHVTNVLSDEEEHGIAVKATQKVRYSRLCNLAT